jgi:hypothetical protein
MAPLGPTNRGHVVLLEAVHRGEFLINGFRNRDLRVLLFGDAPAATPQEAKRQSA